MQDNIKRACLSAFPESSYVKVSVGGGAVAFITSRSSEIAEKEEHQQDFFEDTDSIMTAAKDAQRRIREDV